MAEKYEMVVPRMFRYSSMIACVIGEADENFAMLYCSCWRVVRLDERKEA
jgi:hypothetical protein